MAILIVRSRGETLDGEATDAENEHAMYACVPITRQELHLWTNWMQTLAIIKEWPQDKAQAHLQRHHAGGYVHINLAAATVTLQPGVIRFTSHIQPTATAADPDVLDAIEQGWEEELNCVGWVVVADAEIDLPAEHGLMWDVRLVLTGNGFQWTANTTEAWRTYMVRTEPISICALKSHIALIDQAT